MSDPFRVVRDFEAALCEYTGAPFAVTTTSCTMALLLAVRWHVMNAPDTLEYGVEEWLAVEIPKRTYCSVPMSIDHAGGRPVFREENWRGAYELKDIGVWDCARRFTSGMYHEMSNAGMREPMLCVSFHHSKILGDTQGGAILHSNPEADKWFRKARFDGRTEGVAPKDDDIMLGWHAYMSPDVAARLLWKLSKLPLHNEDLENDQYPDLSLMECFR